MQNRSVDYFRDKDGYTLDMYENGNWVRAVRGLSRAQVDQKIVQFMEITPRYRSIMS